MTPEQISQTGINPMESPIKKIVKEENRIVVPVEAQGKEVLKSAESELLYKIDNFEAKIAMSASEVMAITDPEEAKQRGIDVNESRETALSAAVAIKNSADSWKMELGELLLHEGIKNKKYEERLLDLDRYIDKIVKKADQVLVTVPDGTIN